MPLKDFLKKTNGELESNTAQQVELLVNTQREKYCFQDDMAKDLMVLIGKAIDEWAVHYHMENLPKHILFEQALAIMSSISKTMDELR